MSNCWRERHSSKTQQLRTTVNCRTALNLYKSGTEITIKLKQIKKLEYQIEYRRRAGNGVFHNKYGKL